MKASVFHQPPGMMTPKPALAMAAPANPPMRAWLELLGRPKIPGDDVPGDGADQAGEDDSRPCCIIAGDLDHPLANGAGYRCAEYQEGHKIEERCPDYSLPRRQDPGGDNGGDGIRRVMHAVGEVKNEGQCDDEDGEYTQTHQFHGRGPQHQDWSLRLGRPVWDTETSPWLLGWANTRSTRQTAVGHLVHG